MSITVVSIAWAFLQIALLCSLALLVAWLLRGRRPQLVTAILAGTCIATLLLATTAVVPNLQWSLAINEKPQIGSSPIKHAKLVAEPPIQSALPTDSTNKEPYEGVRVMPKSHVASSGSNSLEAIRSFVSQYLQRVDREVRDVEVWQRPVETARNYSLLVIVSIGLASMSLLWCSSWLFMRRVLRCSQLIKDDEVLCLVASQALEFGLKRTPSVRQSDQVPIGATVGWRRVTVLLHTDWVDWTAEERSAVIAHELAHAARHDFAWVIISSWTRILLFFHPMVHPLIHRLRLEQELAADQLAAGKVGSAKAYGRALASLALRSQRSLGTSNTRLGSMLAAGQICVTRRIAMLRQGSLKPIYSRSSWTIWAVAAIASTAIPFAGLRGITQEPAADTKPDLGSPVQSDASESEKPKPLSKEFLAAFPPVELKGSMVYRPGRFRAGEFGPEAAWMQEWFAISAMGRPMPDRSVAHGECIGVLKWTDEERNHGHFALGAGFSEGEATSPGQLTKLMDAFAWRGHSVRTVSTQIVEGRTITAVADSIDSVAPEKWLIDDEQGYFLGSLEEATKYARGQKVAMDAIPETFREDYRNAAFGIVYDHCDEWPSKIDAFYKDSPREEEFQILGFQPASKIIKDLMQIGVFFDGCKTPACSVRAVMRDARAAKRLVTQVTTLVELGKVAMEAFPTDTDLAQKEAAKSILETMTITALDAEVLIQFDIFVPSLSQAEGPMNAIYSTVGWINFNSAAKCETIGAVTVQPEMSFSSTSSLFGQTLDASDFRGKTVLMELDMQCNHDDASEAGAFVWASRQEKANMEVYAGRLPRQQGSPYVGHRVLAAKTMAANGSSAMSDSIQAKRRMQRNALLPDSPSRTLSVAFEVPNDAEHLSFGCYSKNSEIRVSNVKFQVVKEVAGDAISRSGITDATEDVPYNVLVVPGYKILKSPIELNFEQSVRKSVDFAERPVGKESR